MRPAPGTSQPVLAGIVSSVVGFAGAFTIVLAGLRAVGASAEQAASGLLTVSVLMGLVAIGLGVRLRMPLAIAWSTPGAALLVSVGEVEGGWPAAVGAFLVCGVLIVIAGLWRRLERAIEAIPAQLAAAMLAGVLFPICLSTVRAAVEIPELIWPAIAVWVALVRFARPWAIPVSILAAGAALAIVESPAIDTSAIAPSVVWTTPVFDPGVLVSLALPLFIVTMASQNITGMGVLASFGFRPPLRPILVSTGGATVLGAPFGVHGINLAAITAALTAGPDGGPDPSRRWIASVSGGATYLVIGLGAGLMTAVVAAAPPLLVTAVAGLALLGALTGALAAALADEGTRDAAVITFVVSASSITALGISAPFWGLVAGLAWRAWRRSG